MSDYISQIVAGVLKITPEDVTDDTAMTNTEAWDSLKHMEIIIALEKNFELELTFDEIVQMLSVGAIRRILITHGKS